MKRFLVTVIILYTIFCDVLPQFYSTGEDPSSVKWNRIKTPNFYLVFPQHIAPEANQLANILEFYFPLTNSDLKTHEKKRMQILLHPNSVMSNGYVTLAPFRMELITTPPQETYPQDWFSQLALHETRHMTQMGSMNRGFTRALSVLTGQAGRGIVSAQIPAWFYEGDAVYNETRYSNTGRGRLPSFEMPLKAILNNSHRIFTYDKSLFGSYKDFVPDHYLYGFQMVKFARANFTDTVWTDILKFTGNHPYLIWPGGLRLKTRYGYFNCELYKETLLSLKKQYDSEISNHTYSDYKSENIRKNQVFTSYNGAYAFKDQWLTYRAGLNDPGSFILIDKNGREKRLIMAAGSQIVKFDVLNDILVWDEIQMDPRWNQRSYSVIRSMDLNTKKRKYLTKKSRYFSPDISPEGERIAVSENDIHNNNFLTIISSKNGKVLQRIPMYDKTVLTPEWSGYSDITYVTVSSGGKQLESVNLNTCSKTVYIPVTTTDISTPQDFGTYILFIASVTGTNNIYAVHKLTKDLFQVTHSKYGVKYPSVTKDKKSLAFSDYGPLGYNIAEINIDSNSWEPVAPYLLQPVSVSNGNFYTDSTHEIQYKQDKYRRFKHLFNLHSWLPFYTDINEVLDNPVDFKIYPGLILFSQNLLSTMISSLGYHYEQGYHYIHPSLSWRGWYPVFEISADIGGPPRWIGSADTDILHQSDPYAELNVKTYIPLHFTRGNSHVYITPAIEIEHSSVYYQEDSRLRQGMTFLHLRYNMSNLRRTAVRDLYPRWGQSLAFTYTKSLFEDRQFGSLYSIAGTLFVPGIFRHHHVIIQGGYQSQDPGKYFLPYARVDFPRGYSSAVSRDFSSLQLDYAFPFCYPDLAAGPLLYIKRLRADVFFDMSYGNDIRQMEDKKTVSYTGYYRSYGTELLADLHTFRLLFPFTAGIRLGYTCNQRQFFSEFVVKVNTGF